LTVGPQSAGADPGPACYGQGGHEPTLTDANLVLGRINPEFFLGGEATLDVTLAQQAILEHAARPAGLDLLEAANAIIDIANAKMVSALYFISVEQGIDPRDYVLVPSGGAGPMQAVAIAKALGVGKVLIPPTPGLNSALGMLATDLKHEIVRTQMQETSEVNVKQFSAIYDELETSTRTLLREQNVDEADITVTREVGMCYVGQSYQLRIPVPKTIDQQTGDELTRSFHERHANIYGFANEQEATQIVNLRVVGIGAVDRPVLRQLDKATDSPMRAIKGNRAVYFAETNGMIDVTLYDRDQLRSGDAFSGPAIIEQMDTTIVVPPDTRVEVEETGNLIILLDPN
jgi:N-methylhydantoinase A